MIWPGLLALTLACLMLGAAAYPFLTPDEARHAGIVHDMWAAKQYLIPRVDGFPVLDGAPLYYWLSLGFVSVFGAHEWVLRLPSAIAASALLVVFARTFLPASMRRQAVLRLLLAMFLLQPALHLAGRFASPDMLNVLLLTLSLGCFRQASRQVEHDRRPVAWALGGWAAMALLGLSAGPLAVLPPLLTLALWLFLRRRLGLMASLCWWPGIVIVVVSLMPWLVLANAAYPGIVAAMFHEQMLSVIGGGRGGWALPEFGLGWLLMLAGGLPLVICLHRYRDPARLAALDAATTGLMAAWLAVLVPLHPLMTSSVAGHGLVVVVPLLYFGLLALMPMRTRPVREPALAAWMAFVCAAVVVGGGGAYFFSRQVSNMLPVAQAIRPHYNANTDKAIMLDRFDHAFNFYMRSPKLVYVATNWEVEDDAPQPRWKREFSVAARFVPETANRLMLSTRPRLSQGEPAYDALRKRLCEKRAVNLWVIGSEQSSRHHPILADLTLLEGTGKVRAWYLAAASSPAHCILWAPQH